MLVQTCWFSSLLFIVSATAHAYPPAGLKPRYLVTGTGISLPSTISPPYPSGTASGTSVTTGSTYPTSPAQTNSSTTTSTPTPTPTSSEFFYLVAADTGTDSDGDYVSIGADDPGLLVLYLGSVPNQVASFSTFSINADGTLQNEFAGGIASIFPGGKYQTLMFTNEANAEANGDIISFCQIVGGALTCQTGADTVFSICPSQVIDGTVVGGNVNVGPTTQPGCNPLTLLVVPV
ncbi:MAG: hypothetical protein ALECFALPRED_001113 [Alectoria fallacina]|uniref:Uncharacterized protein n=1 Tax=Alectoria fallacina TaxID=1903189 RepID=A0A8H3PKB5_9LECA|nr:MAG: hypothetical protein ALECFALPRED_001113 [Alectoria fallacina]